MRYVRVRPGFFQGQPMVVYDQKFRLIPYKDEGITIRLNTYISRLIKAGDLIDLDKQENIHDKTD